MLDLLGEYGRLVAQGVALTATITVFSFALGLLISVLLTLARSGGGPLAALAKAYVDVFRGTPLLVQLLFIYFGLPSLGVTLDAFTSSVLAIGLNSGAYQAEILRVALKGIPDEQRLVAKSMGLTGFQVFAYVEAPQALRRAVPGLVNEFVTLLKESSLASVIGVAELTRAGEYMAAATFRALEAYTIVALVYLALSYAVYAASRRVERLLSIPGFEAWSR